MTISKVCSQKTKACFLPSPHPFLLIVITCGTWCFPQWCSETACLIKSIKVSWPRWYLTTLPTWPIPWDFKHVDIHFPARLWYRHLTKLLVNSYGSCPVHKKSSKENPAYDRPISLTFLCCKVMEHIVLSNLNNICLTKINCLIYNIASVLICPVKPS